MVVEGASYVLCENKAIIALLRQSVLECVCVCVCACVCVCVCVCACVVVVGRYFIKDENRSKIREIP